MIGYKYIKESDAIAAIDSVNSNYSFSGETTKFVDYFQVEDFFVIIFFEELRQYLGEPTEINIKDITP